MAEMEGCQMPEPGPEHERLKSNVGTWKVDCTYFMDPSQPPMKVEATETIEMIGPFWTVSLFESSFMSAPFAGRATLGYDPRKEKWIGTWIDAMSPHMYVMEGRYDDDGKVLTMLCEAPAPMMDGKLTQYRSTAWDVDPDQRRFEMFVTMPDGTECQMFSYVYARQ